MEITLETIHLPSPTRPESERRKRIVSRHGFKFQIKTRPETERRKSIMRRHGFKFKINEQEMALILFS
jgi:hypothetical protein